MIGFLRLPGRLRIWPGPTESRLITWPKLFNTVPSIGAYGKPEITFLALLGPNRNLRQKAATVTARTELCYAGEGVVGRGGGDASVFGATSALKAQSKAIIHPTTDHPKKRLTRKMKTA
jgi:hypothetical protein